MKFVRYSAGGHANYGILDGDTVQEISGPPTGRFTETGATAPLSSVQLLAPIIPGDVYAMAVNFKSHTGGAPPPKYPAPFLKPSSSICGPDSAIVLPANAGKVDEEGEMVVVIGRRMRKVSADDALSYVLGYTIGHDISAREWQAGDSSWWRAKGSDTFSPIGPFIETDYDPHDKNIVVTVDGEEVQNCNTEEMIFNTQECLSFISQTNTLEPGDIVFTGTSGVTSRLRAGEVLVTAIQGLGELRNTISD
jgi:2-keto-4-pentenoate hydratase/2-oxohepta-3-ene-1,7-dioic acid hydratase in catechol pathway